MRGSNVMLQQIPQPFVMATFISTTLKSFLITLPGTGETGTEGRKMDSERKGLQRLSKSVCVYGPPEMHIGHSNVKEGEHKELRAPGSKHVL